MPGRCSPSLEQRLRELLDRPATRDLADGLAELVRELVAELRPLAVLLAGSLARGEFVRGMSDVDLLVLVERPPGKWERFRLACVRGVDVQITVFGLREALESAAEGNFFVREALEEGIVLYEASGLDLDKLIKEALGQPRPKEGGAGSEQGAQREQRGR